jgi:hypothetical protein
MAAAFLAVSRVRNSLRPGGRFGQAGKRIVRGRLVDRIKVSSGFAHFNQDEESSLDRNCGRRYILIMQTHDDIPDALVQVGQLRLIRTGTEP